MESVDVVPILVSIVTGGEGVESADGVDLTGLLTGDDVESPREYAVTEFPWSKSVRTENQRLTVYPPGFFGPDSEEYLECYDYREDPWGTTNLAVADSTAVAGDIGRHRRHLQEFLVTTNRPVTVHPESIADAGEAAIGGDHPTVNPARIRQYLAEHGGANYL